MADLIGGPNKLPNTEVLIGDVSDYVDQMHHDLMIMRQQIRMAINQLKAVAAQWEPLPCPRRPTSLHVQRPTKRST